MSNYPTLLDSDVELPPVNNNITEIGETAINACREAIFNIETEVGLSGAGTTGSIATRLGVSIAADGYIKPSALTSLGLVTLPITNSQIISNANIPESKLLLDHKTADLFNYTRDLTTNIKEALGWISITGIKLEPHILGAIYKHSLSGIDVSLNGSEYFVDRFRQFRDNTSAYSALNELNTEVLNHQWSDSTGSLTSYITTNGGSIYSANYGHTSSGIFLDTTRFAVIPQTANDMQQFAQYLDDASIFLYGTRIQNFYSNGVSRVSRSSAITQVARGPVIVPSTLVTTHLLNNGLSSSPVDDIETGDDIVEFTPATAATTNFLFDSQFASAKVGDIVRINYGTIEVEFLLKEKKYIPGSPSRYIVRINSKNLYYKTDSYATIEKPLYNENKYGVLAVAAANNIDSGIESSLIVANPTGAMSLGVGFNPDLLDSTHYNLFLALYPTGNPEGGYTTLPAIDVTGNLGVTPGSYTLDSVVETINDAFRQPGYNYRFVAYSYKGEFGIALADPYHNASFSVFDGIVNDTGSYDQSLTEITFPKNVIGLFGTGTLVAPDPLGYSATNGAISSPPFKTSFGSSAASLYPTKLFTPLDRNTYYVNGTERDKLNLETGQNQDGYGFGYWTASIINRVETPAPNGKVSTTYRISDLVLSTTNLKIGSTIIVQPLLTTNITDFGRYVISDVTFVDCAGSCYTEITVYDAIHAKGISPYASSSSGQFAIYFNSSSVSFNAENANDIISKSPFKRHFEVIIDENSKTFTHERGRFTNGGIDIVVNSIPLRTTSELSKMNLLKISPKLRGYLFGDVNKISLNINSFNATTGVFDGYLASYNGTNLINVGPTTYSKQGQVTRFYDETNIDYIDILFDVNTSMITFTNEIVDIQLYPSLELDGELMLLATCQYNSSINYVNYLIDERQFGNISEKELSTSALDYISLSEKMLHQNGILRGFDAQDVTPVTNPNSGQIYLDGGLVLVGGKFLSINNETVSIPIINEYYNSTYYNINWALCINSSGEYQAIPLLDYDVILSTPNANRSFLAFNPAVSGTYYLESVYFSDIINNRKDLTVLYIIGSVVSGASITLTINDIRKYINDGDANAALKYDAGTIQGNFQSVESIFNWLKYNSDYNGTVVVKGTSTAATVTSNISLNRYTDGNIVIDGEGDGNIIFAGSMTIGSNVTFKNITLTFQKVVTISSSSQNISFENCTINFVPATGSVPSGNNLFVASNSQDIIFKDCTITADYTNNAASNGGSVFNLSGINNFKFIDSTLAVTFDVVTGVNYPGNIFSLSSSCENVKIEGNTFIGNFNGLITSSTSCNGLIARDCTATSTYVPGAELSYDTADLVNTGYGYIYIGMTGLAGSVTTDGITIDNVIFNFTPSSTSNNRFSFINFELAAATSINDVKITNCRFNNTSATTSTDDYRAAIAVINTDTSITAGTSPILRNWGVSRNECDRNQIILLTSTSNINANNVKAMLPTSLTAQDVVIKENICGAIGYWIGSGLRNDNSTPSITRLNNKAFGLVISNNACNIITNLDHQGLDYSIARYSTVQGTYINTCTYPSSYVLIEKNNVGWITSSVAFETNAGIQIVNNTLTAVPIEYVTAYGSDSYFIKKVYYAIHIEGNVYNESNTNTPKSSGNESCIITGNNIGSGYFKTTAGAQIVYSYKNGAIWVRTSAIITNNIYKMIAATAVYIVIVANVIPILLSNGSDFTVTGNQLIRGAVSVGNYIGFEILTDYPAYDGLGSHGVIVNNIFDSPITNGTNTTTINLDVGGTINQDSSWIMERNINQTVTIYLKPLEASQYTSVGGGVHDFWNLSSDLSLSINSSNYEYQTVIYGNAVSAFREIGFVYELQNILPNRVKIVYIQYKVSHNTYSGTATTYRTDWSLVDSLDSDNDTTNIPNTTGNTIITLVDGTDFNDFYNKDGSQMLTFKCTIEYNHSSTITSAMYYTILKYRW